MLNVVDYYLDRITMYRLVLYYLIALLGIAGIGNVFGFITYSPLSILLSSLFLTIVCYITNKIFAFIFEAPTNTESLYITALILACIATPFRSYHDLPFLFWLGVWAMAAKYMFAISKKHLFNPVAIAAVIVGYAIGQSANWWIGNAFMTPFIFIGGILVIKKTQREDLIYSFFFAAISVTLGLEVLSGGSMFTTFSNLLFHSSMLFFMFVMLTEPLTTPSTRNLQMLYGGLVGLLFSPQFHIGSFYFAPELALVFGNIFSYLVSPKEKLVLILQEKIQTGKDTFDFIFPLQKKLSFTAGQYMEWTLPHKGVDSRGNRRYFTLASSPTEDTIRIGVKFYPQGSSYKKAMLTHNGAIVAANTSGDFILPNNPQQKLVFVAGGIGITPFRSMIKYLVDTNQKRNIVLLYSNKSADEIAYTDVFYEAEKKLGIKTIYTLTDQTATPANWQGKMGRIDAALINQEIPDFKERLFYLSGPHIMVAGFEETLRSLGIPQNQIKKDFFPGFV